MRWNRNSKLPEWSEKIRETRGDRTQVEFAEACYVSQNTISRWENGIDEPTESAYVRLAMVSAGGPHHDYFVERSGFKQLFEEARKSFRSAPDSGEAKVSATARHKPGPPPPTPPRDNTFAPSVNVPLLRNPQDAGKSSAEAEKYLPLPMEWFGQNRNLCAVRIMDDLMMPLLSNESIVVVDTSRKKPDSLVDNLVAVKENDQVLIRWLRNDGKDYFLVPQRNIEGLYIRRLQLKGEHSIIGAVALIARR